MRKYFLPFLSLLAALGFICPIACQGQGFGAPSNIWGRYPYAATEERIVRGDSLSPIIGPGCTVRIVFGYYQEEAVKRDDIVAYQHPGCSKLIIKIVKGVPQDTFELKELKDGSSYVLINGEILKNSLNKPYKFKGNRKKMLSLYEKDYGGFIPENTYLLLGNLVSGSMDSSRFGLVDKKGILGKVELVK